MRISNKMMYSNLTYNLMKSEELIQKLNTQYGTGRRIQKPSDDPIGTARAMSYRTRSVEINQYVANSERAISWLNFTDGALMTLNSNYLQRVRELVEDGANSDLTNEAREALAIEVDQILEGIIQLANTNIDHRYVFAGYKLLEPPYQMRKTVAGDTINFALNPIVLDSRNNQIQVKLNSGQTALLTLTPKTYDGSPGHTLEDLAVDIRNQLRKAGFDVPVSVKATPDGHLEFYAGTNPPDGKMYPLVLREGPAIKEVGRARNGNGALNEIRLGSTANDTVADFYSGWQIKITSGTGAGQVRTISGYDETNQTATVTTNWAVAPDATSEYIILPPLEGTATGTGDDGAGHGTINLNPNAASGMNNFYNGMTITVSNSKGETETRQIIGYNAATRQITVDEEWTISGISSYTITPHLSGAAGVTGTPATIGLDLTSGASRMNDFYNGASITVTYANGTTETRKITSYNGTTGIAEVDGGDWRDTPVSYQISDTALSQLGFTDKATTKELVGTPLSFPLQVLAKYPETGMVQVAPGPIYSLASGTSGIDDYYLNWTITVTDPTGAIQTDTIDFYDGATRTFTTASGLTITADSQYQLTPPLTGDVAADLANLSQIKLSPDSSMIDDFYVGMPITITYGDGQTQTRTITAYDPTNQTATLDEPWSVQPTTDSKYSIDADHYQNANNKFTIKVGNGAPQEISLDGGSYTAEEFARMIESKIQARGGEYANIKVQFTSDNRLRFVHQNDLDTPLPIELTSGSEADALWILGFASGANSDKELPNYEGDGGAIEYEISTGTEIQVNFAGDRIFDKIIQDLVKISMNLRSGNVEALSGEDLRNIRLDIEAVSIIHGEIGAKVNRLENGIDRLKSLNENLTKLLSDVEDTDYTKVTIDLEMQLAAYQAALQAAGRILPMTLLDYLR